DEVGSALTRTIGHVIDVWGTYFLGAVAGVPHPAMRAIRDSATRIGLLRYITAITETRSKLTRVYHTLFSEFDFLVTATSPVSAFVHPGVLGGNTEIDRPEVGFSSTYFHSFTVSP